MIEAALTKHREKETAEEWARGRIGRVGWHDVFVSCITPTIDVSIAISDHHENTKYGRYVFLAKGRILRNPTYTCSFHDPMIKREDQPAPGIHAIYIYIYSQGYWDIYSIHACIAWDADHLGRSAINIIIYTCLPVKPRFETI